MSDLEESPVPNERTLFKTLVLVLARMQLNLVFNPQRHCLLLYCRVDYQIVTSPAFPLQILYIFTSEGDQTCIFRVRPNDPQKGP